MKQLLFISLLIISGLTKALDQNCSNPTQKSCDFYKKCVENTKGCGVNGYAIGYGDKYCNRFLKGTFSATKGKLWVKSTLLCLQNELVPVLNTIDKYNCSDISNYAFDSHPKCYLNPVSNNSDISVCWLPLKDLRQIFKVIDFKDMISRKALKQEKIVAKACAKKIIRKWFTGRKSIQQEDSNIEKVNFFDDMANR